MKRIQIIAKRLCRLKNYQKVVFNGASIGLISNVNVVDQHWSTRVESIVVELVKERKCKE